MINPLNEVHRNRTRDAIKLWRQRLDPICADRTRWLKKYRGRDGTEAWTPADKRKRRMDNRMLQAGSTYQHLLAAECPQYAIETRSPPQASQAYLLQWHLNDLVREIHLEDSLEKCVLDAFFLMGIMEIYMADSVAVELEENVYSDPGRPFAGPISLDNWFHDLHADHWGRVKIMGKDYSVSRERMLDSSLFRRSVVEQLPIFKGDYTGDGRERSTEISGGGWSNEAQIEDEVRLRDVYFASEKLIVTWPVEMNTPPLRVLDWEGDDGGPYPILTFDDVPDNTLPVSMAENLEPSDDLNNSLLNKLGRQARKARMAITYTAEAAKDAENLRNAEDLAWVRVKDPRAINPISIDGVNKNVQGLAIQAGMIHDRQSGNLPALAGLGPSTSTASGDSLVHQNASGKISKMGLRVQKFTARIGKELARLIWNDRANFREGWYEVPGMPELKVPAHWHPDRRVGSFESLRFEVVPFSMRYQSPEEKAQAISQSLQELSLWSQQGAEQGIQVSFEKLVKLLARRRHLEELADLYDLYEPAASPTGDGQRRPPMTTRETIRRNVPTAGTADNREQVLLQSLLGAGANSDQMATLQP